jgi:hypothetical protein
LLNYGTAQKQLVFAGYRRTATPVLPRVGGLYGCQDNDVPDGCPRRTFQDILGWPAEESPVSRTILYAWDPLTATYTANTFARGSWSGGPPCVAMGHSVWIFEPQLKLLMSPEDETEPPTPPPFLMDYETVEAGVATLNLEWLWMQPVYLQQCDDVAGNWTYVIDSGSGLPANSPYAEPMNIGHSRFFRLTTDAPAGLAALK